MEVEEVDDLAIAAEDMTTLITKTERSRLITIGSFCLCFALLLVSLYSLWQRGTEHSASEGDVELAKSELRGSRVVIDETIGNLDYVEESLSNRPVTENQFFRTIEKVNDSKINLQEASAKIQNTEVILFEDNNANTEGVWVAIIGNYSRGDPSLNLAIAHVNNLRSRGICATAWAAINEKNIFVVLGEPTENESAARDLLGTVQEEDLADGAYVQLIKRVNLNALRPNLAKCSGSESKDGPDSNGGNMALRDGQGN